MLKKELESQKNKNYKVIEDYNHLVKDYNHLNEENSLLKDRISDLKAEISLIYKSTRDFLKDRTSDLQAFKSLFKDLVDTISNKIGRKDLENNFKTEYDKENRRITRDRGMSR